MQELDDFVAKRLDPTNFDGLLASAKTAAAEPNLQAHVEAAQAQVAQLTDYAKANASSPLVSASKDLLGEAGGESWIAIGNAEFTSFYWWAFGGGVSFSSELPLSFLFGGKGSSWGAWSTFSAPLVGGSFILDPKVIVSQPEFKLEQSGIGWVKKGPCNFALGQGGAGAGDANIQFWGIDGKYWGSVNGPTGGIGGVSISGELELVWQGFPT
jgi:hypothetical protein